MASNNKTSKTTKKTSGSKNTSAKTTKPELKTSEISAKPTKKVTTQPVKMEQKVVTMEAEKMESAKDKNYKYAELLKDENLQNKAISVLIGVVFIAIILSVSFIYIPHVLNNTDEAIAARIRKENETKAKETAEAKAKQIEQENSVLKIDSTSEWKIAMDVKDFGTINLTLKKEYAPATVENFVRLTSRKFYDGNRPHRIVEVDNFKVLQGGDPKEDGTGGETASGNQVPDEIWKDGKSPQYKTEGNAQVLTNTPELRAPSLYSDFNSTTGQITYRKGLILMAKTSAPNSATSQYFITLDKTVLPADYTVFGTVDDSSLSILDQIVEKVNPIIAEGSDPAMGGKPDPELTTTTVKIISQF